MSFRYYFCIFICFLFFQNLFALDIIKRNEPALWNDTIRVAIIWNNHTEDDDIEDWGLLPGQIGEESKDFLLQALVHLDSSNIKVYSGGKTLAEMNLWDTLTLNGIKKDFGNKMPHVIAYISAGYEWGQYAKENGGTVPKDPFEIISNAMDEGVGIVAIGDDAAYDSKDMFPLTGLGGLGEPNRYDDYNEMYEGQETSIPMMSDGARWSYLNELWIWLDKNVDEELPDGGLLWSLENVDTLHYKSLNNRGQADADIWDVDVDKLDDYSFVGYQQGKFKSTIYYGGKAITHIGNTPIDEVLPQSNTYSPGNGYYYTTLAGLQQGNHRIAIIGYQPQYLNNADASGQILYNSIFWASKAHAKQKITTPVPDPLSGTTSDVSSINLSVISPKNSSLYSLHYTTDGSTPTKSSPLYTGASIQIPAGTKSDFTIKAIAFSNDTLNWINSDMMVVTYEYSVNKISTPVADPENGNTQTVKDVSLSVANPTDANLYKVIYTFDESDSLVLNGLEYNGGKITLPQKITKDVTIYAKAVPVNTNEWKESNVMKVVYKYVGGPLIDYAEFHPGKLADQQTSEREDDTLIVWFNTEIKPINTSTPFMFKDFENNGYVFTIDTKNIVYDSLKVTFIVNGVTNKSNAYIPVNNQDSIAIDPKANISDLEGVLQDGSNNFFVPLKVASVPIDLTIKIGWMDIPVIFEEITDIKEGALITIDLGAVINNEEMMSTSARMSVFDMLGNEVIQSDNILNEHNGALQGIIKEINGRNQLAIAWSGENSAGRRVGSGSYVARVLFKDPDGKETLSTIIIGVPGMKK